MNAAARQCSPVIQTDLGGYFGGGLVILRCELHGELFRTLDDDYWLSGTRANPRQMSDNLRNELRDTWQQHLFTSGPIDFQNMSKTLPPIEVFTEQEMRAIVTQFARARGAQGFTAEEVDGLLKDAVQTRLMNDLLELVISGRLLCNWNGKEMTLCDAQAESVELHELSSVSRRLHPDEFLDVDKPSSAPQSPPTGQ